MSAHPGPQSIDPALPQGAEEPSVLPPAGLLACQLAAATFIGALARALGARPNLVLPGKDLRQGPLVAEAELLATAELAVEHGAIEERERTGPAP